MAMKYGISTIVGLARLRNLKEKVLPESYLSLLDYSTWLASKYGFKIIEITPSAPLTADVLSRFKGEIKEKIGKFETICHLPSGEINICALNPQVREASVAETKKLIDLAKEMGIGKVSMHPGCYAAMPDTYALLGQQLRTDAQESIFDIFKHCRSNGLELCLENLPFNEPFFQRPDEFKPFVAKGVGILIDAAHAVTAGVDPNEFISVHRGNISEVHLVDGFKGKMDVHYALGAGELNYSSFLDELKKASYNGPVILELKSEEDLVASLNILTRDGYL